VFEQITTFKLNFFMSAIYAMDAEKLDKILNLSKRDTLEDFLELVKHEIVIWMSHNFFVVLDEKHAQEMWNRLADLKKSPETVSEKDKKAFEFFEIFDSARSKLLALYDERDFQENKGIRAAKILSDFATSFGKKGNEAVDTVYERLPHLKSEAETQEEKSDDDWIEGFVFSQVNGMVEAAYQHALKAELRTEGKHPHGEGSSKGKN